MNTKKGAWKYENYTPDWVVSRIRSRKNIEIVSIDCANHPLDTEKSYHNLNTVATFYRHPEYPFWVEQRNVEEYLFMAFDGEEPLTKEDFLIILKSDIEPVYTYFCNAWYGTNMQDYCKNTRNALILASKGM